MHTTVGSKPFGEHRMKRIGGRFNLIDANVHGSTCNDFDRAKRHTYRSAQLFQRTVLAVPDAILQPAGRLVPEMRKPTGSVMVSVPLAALLPPRLLMLTSSVLGVLTVRAVTPPRLGVRSAGGGVVAVSTKAAVLLLVTFSPATAVMAALMV